MSKMTMQEIARMAGVSLATVSRSLRNPNLVSPRTRQRVLAVIEESNYVYNATAGDLSRKKSSVIGVTIPTTRNPIFASSTLAIQEVAQEKGFSIILGNTKYDTGVERKILQNFQERRVSGMILTGFNLEQETLIRNIIQTGMPLLVIWEKLSEHRLSFIGFDNFRASYAMTEYLISLRHKRVALIIGLFSEIGRVKKRFEGYRSALEDRGIPYDPELVIENEPMLYNGKEAITRLMSLPNPPTAIFAASDMLAIGALSGASELGLRVPQDVSIAGFDDIDFAAYCYPPLTTIRVPSHEIGRLAAKYLIEAIEDGVMQPRHYCLDTDLIIRSSCCEFRG